MNLVNKLQEHSQGKAFFYVTLDPERAIGIEDILPNYAIICPYTSRLTTKLKKDRMSVVVLEEELAAKKVEQIIKKGTYGMLQSKLVHDYINNNVGRSRKMTSSSRGRRKPHILILKNSALIEDLCKKNKWKLLAPKAEIAEQFENKISQYALLKNIVEYPETRITTLESLLAESDHVGTSEVRLRRAPQPPLFVLQFNRGHSGNSTFFIHTKKDLRKLYKLYPKREVKISKYIKGKTYTLNCLVLENGNIITGSISEQITGLKTATNNPNTTVGNNFLTSRKFSPNILKSVQKIAKNVGTELYRKGYKGFFGIDVIIEKSSSHPYFIEVNTHQPASISFEAKLHRKIGKIPLLAYFILDNIGEKTKSGTALCLTKLLKRDVPPIVLPISAKQIIYRNKENRAVKVRDIDRKYGGRYLISRMKIVRPNEEIYRKQYIK